MTMNTVNNMSTVNQPELKQPEKAVSSEDIDNFIVDVFKETGHKISKDDPVISLIFLNQKIQKNSAMSYKLTSQPCLKASDRSFHL